MVAEVIPEIGLAEEVVQVAVEAIPLVIDDEHILDLLHDELLEAIVHNLQVLLLHLDNLLLIIDVVEAVNEVEATEAAVVLVEVEATIGRTLGVRRQALRHVYGFCGCVCVR